MLNDPQIIRTRTTHGWAFSDLKPEVENRVKAYLADGDPFHLENTKYLDARAGVLSRLSNKERRGPRHGSVWFSIGLTSECRGSDLGQLDEDVALACVRMLRHLVDKATPQS